MPAVPIATLRESAARRLVEAGVPHEDAAVIIDHLLTAELWGRTTHGLSLRFPWVLRHAESGAGTRRPHVAEDWGGLVVLDGQDGFGYVSGNMAAHVLVERVERHGWATVAVRNSGHTGLIGYYLDKVARAGVVGLAFANCSPLMAPCGGREAFFGTNPITFAFPAEPDPVLVDMATSKISYGELVLLEQQGRELPPGCALDENGEPTTDPSAGRRGALLPFGEHKGSALAMAVQILAGLFLGGAPVPPGRKGYGLLLIGYARDTFAGPGRYEQGMKELLDQYLAVPPRAGMELHVPGRHRYENRRRQGDAPLEVTDELMELLGLA